MAIRPLSLAPILLGLAAVGLAPSPGAAQDIFNPFGDAASDRPARKKPAEDVPLQPNVLPDRVERGALPDVSPATQPPADADAAPAGQPPARLPDDEGTAGYEDQQFDPIEARRSGYRPARAAPQEAPAGYENPDGDRRRDDRGPPPADDALETREPPPQQFAPSPRPSGERQSLNAPPPRAPESLSYDPWAGVPAAELEELLSRIDLPPRSSAVSVLWTRLITAEPGPNADPRLVAVRADALNRTGLTREASAALARAGDLSADPVMATLAARTAIGAGDTERGCETARSLTSSVAAKMPPNLKGEVILIAGFCAAASDNKAAAGIAADLATENGLGDHAGPDALKAIAAGHKPAVGPGKKVSLLDYRILQLAGPIDITQSIPTASPALLAVLARDPNADPASRLAAAEAATGLNTITLDELAETYRANAGTGDVELSDAARNAGQPARRAALFVAAENERAPLRKARYIRAFLDEALRAQLYWPALQLMARPANDLQPVPEISWFAETAIEASLAAGDYNAMQRWIESPAVDSRTSAGLRHWMALADIADPNPAQSRTQNLRAVEELAQHGRLDPLLLHRLATVLEALDTNVPIPLWEAAGRTEQPTTGHLPDTGVLSQLQDAAKKRDFARVVLLTMRTLGPNGAEGAHIIALGDSIRALKRAGLEPEARRLGLEAVFAGWPRALAN